MLIDALQVAWCLLMLWGSFYLCRVARKDGDK